jgi:predicted O-linked N-acetylglucosamine transferase (SPINDLY family)
MGASVARAAGFPDLVAGSSEEYVETAVRIGGDRPALAELRKRAAAPSQLFDLAGWLRAYQVLLSRAWENRLAERLGDLEIPVRIA